MLVADPIRYAMIGGGEGAFIGPVHRIAAAIAGNCELVAGALSSDPDKAKRSGAAIGLRQSCLAAHAGRWVELAGRDGAASAGASR